MSLDAFLSQLTNQRRGQHDLEGQVRAMRRDVQHLVHQLAHLSGHTTHNLGGQLQEMGTAAAAHGSEWARLAGEQAMHGARLVRRDPLPAIALVSTTLLLLRLLKR
ncbi:hypothetical protein [uncultured Devosia sp.]|uniref:hypothetical protein n=1 Tax=uncultured Devosia sp. TaxID=211434 RepID=UPI00262CEAAA|nr:hypothetical protein [uncultured Devosia sp.]